MTKVDDQIIIKKYANRRLYNTGSSSYVTLEDLATMVKNGDDFIVQDAKSGDDITRLVLAQIIFDQEAKEGQSLLPINFLRQLISFYGNSMQTMVPSYLEYTLNTFAREQDKMKEQMGKMFGVQSVGGFEQLEAQTRQNMEMFQKAMGMLVPFGVEAGSGEADTAPKEKDAPSNDDLQAMRDELAALKKKLDKLD